MWANHMATSEEIDIEMKNIGNDVARFVVNLLLEGERSAVVLGAARLDVSLEKLLKAVIKHNPGGVDNLFDTDRPLGTFSAKIGLAHRLGLIDSEFEHSLQMIRKLRNDFAHSIISAKLIDSPHKERVAELIKTVKKDHFWSTSCSMIQNKKLNPNLLDFGSAMAVLLMNLETTTSWSEPITIKHVCHFYNFPNPPAK